MATADEQHNDEHNDGIEETPAPVPEVEKPSDIHLEADAELAPVTPAIDPVIEKRLLQKLDRRVPVITGLLCMFPILHLAPFGYCNTD